MATPDLRLLHFNDVYHIEPSPREPVGGAARFVTVVNEYRDPVKYAGQVNLVNFFSGDAFNPSIESSVTKGRHMVPILRDAVKVDVACCGNHDFDFGVGELQHLVEQCRFPWLLANVFDPATGGKTLGNAPQTYMLTASNGLKIGLMGLVEKAWLDTINSLPADLDFVQPADIAKQLAPKLREQGADIIIALTHMREPNDVLLASSIPEGLIDIILGGHDHYYNYQVVNGTPILRSGSDFKQLTYIEAFRTPSHRWEFTLERRDITSDIKEDPPTKEIVSALSDSLVKRLEKPIGYSSVDLDARFSTVRTAESNYGSLICDLMRFYYSSDIALMAGGTMRGDQIYPAGVLKLGDIISCFPFEDPCVVIRVSGAGLLAALENSVSKLPALEGRFCQVSGLKFGYNPQADPGHRVNWVTIGDNDRPLELDAKYSIATRGYMARGKDGFESLNVKTGNAEEIVNEEHGVLISMIIRQYFLSLKIVSRWRRGAFISGLFSQLRNLQTNCGQLSPKIDSPVGLENDEYSGGETSEDEAELTERVSSVLIRRHVKHEEDIRLLELKKRVASKWETLTKIGKAAKANGGPVAVDWCRSVRPQVEGRICIVDT